MRILAFAILGFLHANLYADYAEVILLGTGTPRPSIERFGSATLINIGGEHILFDVGRGATIRLHQAGISPNRIDKVFITHLHSDHISGLGDLWMTGWIWQRHENLVVYGPSGVDNMIENLQKSYAADISYRTSNVGLDEERSKILSVEIDEGVVYEKDGIKINAFLVDHKPVEPALGYRIQFGDKVIVLSGDTTYSENLIKHAQDADLLIHEIASADETLLKRNKRLQSVMAYHTNPMQMSDILNKTHPRSTVLNHVLLFGITEQTVIEEIRQHYSGDLMMGYDLMKIGIGDSINIEQMVVK